MFKSNMKKVLVFFLFIFLALPISTSANFSDTANESLGFSGGTHSATQWDAGNTWVELTGAGQTAGTGTYTSRIIDALASTSWSTFAWNPSQPYLKELPNSAASETAYSAGNADMSNNVLLLHLNESSGTPADSSGSAHDGSCTNCPTFGSAGLFNTSFTFDGSNDVVTVNDHDDLDGGNKYTFSMWVNPTALTTRDCFLAKWNTSGTGTGNSWGIRTNSSFADEIDVIIAANSTDTGGTYYSTSDADLQAGVWSHVVVVYDGTLAAANRVAVYVNGVLKSGSVTGTLPTSLQNSNKVVTLGRQFVVNVTQHFYNGKMDEVSFWKRAITATEVLNFYKRGAERLRFRVRSCNDAACSGESFIGPDGTQSSYFEEQDSNTISLPSASLSGIAADNRYFQYEATLETSDTSYTPDINSVTVGSPSIGVLSTNFPTLYSSTDFTAENDLSSVSGVRLGTVSGNILWTNALDVRQQDFDSNVSVGTNYVSVNATNLSAAFDSAATVALNVSDCNSYTLYYEGTYRTNAADIIANGQVCDANTTPACTVSSCVGGVLTFTVPHFDSYAVGGPAAAVPEYSTLLFAFMVSGLGWYMTRKTAVHA